MVRRLVHLRHDEWGRPRCSICRAGRAGEIDLLRIEKLLADRAKLKAVAAKFGLKHDALRPPLGGDRHRPKKLSAGGASAQSGRAGGGDGRGEGFNDRPSTDCASRIAQAFSARGRSERPRWWGIGGGSA